MIELKMKSIGACSNELAMTKSAAQDKKQSMKPSWSTHLRPKLAPRFWADPQKNARSMPAKDGSEVDAAHGLNRIFCAPVELASLLATLV